MALNFVTVTGTFYAATALGTIAASGNILFQSSDVIWSTASLFVGVIENVGASFNANGQISASLLAMDNAGLSGNWAWLCTITLGGIVFPRRKLAVNFSSGATQDISALLSTSTLA